MIQKYAINDPGNDSEYTRSNTTAMIEKKHNKIVLWNH